jgi:hypothetical protein
MTVGGTYLLQALASKGLICGARASGEQAAYIRKVMVVPRRVSIRSLERRSIIKRRNT